ncbi:hypothetical protein G6O67_002267 [Ophiocordyceps sinensis]|uniref:Stress activated map kinase interacting n=1 Tax=Ophiocordyceps sinensis TaxID=72228 RepID=A0A8H4V731_9HYPO|nr:hypothetical protein G6O67_002267 [Ophiocordyceps sinensis]
MVLVDYSESDASGSESESPPKPGPSQKATVHKKQPFQKVFDRSNGGKIVVSLPQQESAPAHDEPPAKRARTSGATPFSGFNSMLPAPKNAPKAGGRAKGPAFGLKTSAEPGFRRGGDDNDGYGDRAAAEAVKEAPPNRAGEAPVSLEQKPADEVKLVGKPLMFRPLSVARTANKKKKGARVGMSKVESATSFSSAATQKTASPASSAPPKKVSLFSLYNEESQERTTTRPESDGAYEPLFEAGPPPEANHEDHVQYAAQTQRGAPPSRTGPDADNLDSIADDLNLSAAARRELFGREGGNRAVEQVINFNTDQEYQHNETIRAAGEQQIHQPVRALQGGKHSLQQLIQNVNNQREALEDSFAKGKSNRKEASSRYGW